MIKTSGKKSAYKPIEVVSKNNNTYIVRWDYVEISFNESGTALDIDTDLAYWTEEIFYHLPTIGEIRSMVYNYFNNITNDKILKGFNWNGLSIWLSPENQHNYKAAYDLAIQTNGDSLPYKIKYGNDENPNYYLFTDLSDLTQFYKESFKFIEDTLQECWDKKDNFDITPYKLLLDK